MIIAHISDIHGELDLLLEQDLGDAQWVVNTGDFMPNFGREGTRIQPEREMDFQDDWCHENAKRLSEWIGGRRFLTLPGNHDFSEDLGNYLEQWGVLVHEMDDPEVAEVIDGYTVCGFGEVPYLTGEWNGEVTQNELSGLVNLALGSDPTILLTHAPPQGILDKAGYGIGCLNSRLTYNEHSVKLHLFGHCHEQGGKMVEEMGIRFYNGAGKLRFIEV